MYHVHQPLLQKQQVTQSLNWQLKSLLVWLLMRWLTQSLVQPTQCLNQPLTTWLPKSHVSHLISLNMGNVVLVLRWKRLVKLWPLVVTLKSLFLKLVVHLKSVFTTMKCLSLPKWAMMPWWKRLLKRKMTVSSTFLKLSVVVTLLKNCQSWLRLISSSLTNCSISLNWNKNWLLT